MARSPECLRTDLLAAARQCRRSLAEDDGWPPDDVGELDFVELQADDDFCLDVADRFDAELSDGYDLALAARYERMKAENLHQYHSLVQAGILVEPWLGRGQPYRNSGEMTRSVLETRTLRVFLTRDGHGPDARRPARRHPLRQPAGVIVGGVSLTHNDLLRVTHDVFGHVMLENPFTAQGELRAAYCHMTLFSAFARPVLFTENVAQTCWFFFGRHLRDADGRLLRPQEPGYVPPRRRPYPEQKVFAFEQPYLEAFQRMFAVRERV